MDLIERYLAVADACAARRPSGLAAEFRRLLLARIEAREAALGRPLNTAEATAELVGFARRLVAEAAAVMRRFEGACLGLEPLSLDIPEGES
jgi:hypothetical protein